MKSRSWACVNALAVSVVLAGAALPVWADETQIVIAVPGIPGPYCAYGVEKRLLELSGVDRVELLWPKEEIRAVLLPSEAVTAEQIKTAIELADYPYEYRIADR